MINEKNYLVHNRLVILLHPLQASLMFRNGIFFLWSFLCCDDLRDILWHCVVADALNSFTMGQRYLHIMNIMRQRNKDCYICYVVSIH